ncbi:MAG: ATP-binding protein [Bryobacteraceae bacterium]
MRGWIAPSVVAGVVLALALYLGHTLAAHDASHIRHATQMMVADAAGDVTEAVGSRILGLVRMARRWEVRGQRAPEEWALDAQLQVAHLRGYYALGWLDPSGRVRSVVGPDAAAPVIDAAALAPTIALAQSSRQAVLSPWFGLPDRTAAVAAVVPLFSGGSYAGCTVGVFRLSAVLDTAATGLGDYSVELMAGTGRVGRYAGPNRAGEVWASTAPVRLYNASWTVRVWPGEPTLAVQRRELPLVVVIAGLLLAALGAAAVRLGQTAARRARQAEDANRELGREIAERELAQEALARARDELELRIAERTAELAAANAELRAQMAERQRFQEQLIQSQKMEAVGRLAGGLAHDLNNVLTVIAAYAEQVHQDPGVTSAVREQAAEILASIERAGALTTRLLAVGRRQKLQPQRVDLSALVLGTEDLLRQLVGADIDLKISTGSGPETILADPRQIEQVILNLVINARDAMPRGGRLTLQTGHAEINGHGAGELAPGRYAQLIVSDTGTGMTPEVQSHLFEPFFTTKEPGKGTGLGLSTAYGIVKQSGGAILVETEPGRGSRFAVCLPTAGGSAESPAIPHGPDRPPMDVAAQIPVSSKS